MTIEPDVVNRVKEWFEKQGNHVLTNVRLNKNHQDQTTSREYTEIDILAKKESTLIGVEIKAGVLHQQLQKSLLQAISFKPYVNFAYIVFPFIPPNEFILNCRSVGIGIISSSEIKTDIILEGERNKCFVENKEIKELFKNGMVYNDPHLNDLKNIFVSFPLLLAIMENENKPISQSFLGSCTTSLHSQQTTSRHICLFIRAGLVQKERTFGFSKGVYSYRLTDDGKRFLVDVSDRIRKKLVVDCY